MNLHGQADSRRGERGYAMAALLVGLAVMAVMLTVAMPVWKTAARREREAELIWRGTQYARAVALFRRKYANAAPPNLDILLNERFLRKKYKDPMTNEDFQLVYATDQQQRAGETGARTQPSSQLDPPSGVSAGARGGIIGVVSKSSEKGLRVFNGRSKYNEWAFTPETVGLRMPGAQSGADPRGQGPPSLPGGRPGPMGVPRQQINLDRSGRVTTPMPPAGGQQPPGPQPFGLPRRPPS